MQIYKEQYDHRVSPNRIVYNQTCAKTRKNETKEYTALRYRVLSGDSFESLIFFLRVLLVVALDRRSAGRRVSLLNHLSFPYTRTNRKGQCMSHVITTHHPGDPRQTVVSDLPKVILCLVVPILAFCSVILLLHVGKNDPDGSGTCLFTQRTRLTCIFNKTKEG